ncbi:MAG TPA: glycoside hydrolase family 3 C-terminal domain-containing protein, partial [Solirubrobacteraceae bacterium]|nr:glycoside hydrolase family 3 C-terminal domain-containing protein [Solirubrobacteraceae bacterium]
MSRFRLLLAAVALVCAAALTPLSPAHAAGRCGDLAERPWCDTSKSPDERAGLLLAALTRDERISLLAGDELLGAAGFPGTHTGTSNGVSRVGLPTVLFSDGPVGTRQGKATAMPAPMSLAATFDPDAAVRHAEVIGDEVQKKGNDVVFAPAVNMLRTPLNGRTFEYFGEDPYLSARMAVAWTKGVQATGVIGNVKHFAVNNQEGVGFKLPGSLIGTATEGSRTTINANVDERALREIYLPQFEAAVKEGGVGTVMCAYPRVNGQWACENEHLLTDILKREWGFQGLVLTDYGAAKDTVLSLRNGLDLDIWPGTTYAPRKVKDAIESGEVSEEVVTEHVRRILRTLFAHGFFDRAAFVDDESRIDKAAHHEAAGQLSAEGAVLLENDGGLLPLDQAKLGKVALIGPEADALKNGGGSSQIDAYQQTTPRDALEAKLGGKLVFDDGRNAARAAGVARDADVAVVVVGDQMNEGNDKPCMGLSCGSGDTIDRDALIEAVAAAQPRTVVVLQTGGPVLMPWRDRVPSILEAWYPGQNGGTAIARLLLGEAEPGGRLPATFPLAEGDLPTANDKNRYPGVDDEVQYSEGVFIGYRWYDRRGLGVAYPFGHGLSYTTFAYDDLRREADAPGAAVTVSARVTNTGARVGMAVPQLYVSQPDQPEPGVEVPPRQLKGFGRVRLAPGESARVTFTLDERAFSYWSVAGGGWRVAPGCHELFVGASSRDLPLR